MDKNERISHLIGSGLALAGLVTLVVYAAWQGDPWKIVSFSIYCTTLVMMPFPPSTTVSGARRNVYSRNWIIPRYIF